MGNIIGFATLFVVSMGLAVIVYVSFKKTLCSLLDEVVKIPPATTFYLRMFLICLFFLTISAVLKTTFNLDKGKPFMEFVWTVASGLSEFFGNISIFLLVYLLFITLLVVVLGRRNDK